MLFIPHKIPVKTPLYEREKGDGIKFPIKISQFQTMMTKKASLLLALDIYIVKYFRHPSKIPRIVIFSLQKNIQAINYVKKNTPAHSYKVENTVYRNC